MQFINQIALLLFRLITNVSSKDLCRVNSVGVWHFTGERVGLSALVNIHEPHRVRTRWSVSEWDRVRQDANPCILTSSFSSR